MKLSSFLLSAVVAAGPVAAPSVAMAQSEAQDTPGGTQATIEKIVQLNREAVGHYQKKKYEAARKALKQALDLCTASGLERHPVAARTHIHLGIVIVGGFGQREIGAKQFSEALQIQPDITLTPGVASPAVEDVFNETAVAVTPRASAPRAAVAEAAPAEPLAAERDEEPRAEPVGRDEAPRPTVVRRAAPRADSEDGDREGDDDGDDGDESPKRAGFQIGAVLGAGAGYASGNGDVNANVPVDSGFAAAKLGHVGLEVGYWATPTVMVSLQGRFQKVSGPTIVQANGKTYEPASGATAIFAAATWSPGTSRLRPFVSAAVGGGRIRHVVTVSNVHDCGATRNEACVDTVGAGPFLAGLGGGLTYDLGERLSLIAGVATQVGAPRFTFNIDFNAGVAFRL